MFIQTNRWRKVDRESEGKMLKIPFDVVYGCERINILKVDKLEKGHGLQSTSCTVHTRTHSHTNKSDGVFVVDVVAEPLENVVFRIQPSI